MTDTFCGCYTDTAGPHLCAYHRARHFTGRDCIYRVQITTAGYELACIYCGSRPNPETPSDH